MAPKIRAHNPRDMHNPSTNPAADHIGCGAGPIWRPTPLECMGVCLDADPGFASGEPGLGAPTIEQFERALRDERFEVLAAAGAIVVLERRWDVCWDIHVAAASSSRGAQLVATILGACETVARSRGARHFVAPVPSRNRPAAHLAVACGFSREGVLKNAFRGRWGADNIILFGRDWS